MVGDSGSGKSSLADALAVHLGVPVVDLDALYHEPGWRAPPTEVFRARVQSALLAPEAVGGYVVAGNYSQVQDLTWDGADTVVWLDFPLRITLPRLLRRSWRRSRSRCLLWGTNRERFWPQLKLWSTGSLLGWNLKQHRRRRRAYEAEMHDPRRHRTRFVRMLRPAGVDAFRRDLGIPHRSAPPDAAP